MGIIINQSIRNALISYLGIVIGFISTVKLFPNILDTEQYGLTRTMLAFMFIGSQTICLGIPGAVIKYFPFLANQSKNPKGLFLTFCIPLLLAFLAFSLGFILSEQLVLKNYENSTLMRSFYYFILPLVLFSSLFNLLSSYINSHLDTIFVSFLQEVLLRVIVILALILFYFDYIKFNEFIAIFVFNYGLQFLILSLYGLKNKYFNLTFSFDLVSKPILKKVGTFSMYSFLGGFTMIIVGNIDLLMIGSLTSLAETGVYSIAFYVGSVISIPRRSISKIALPIISQSFERSDNAQIAKVYKQTSLNQFLFGLLIFIGVWSNMDNLYAMLPEEYAAGSLVILIIGFANLIDMVTGSNSEIIVSSPFYRFGLYFSIFLVFLTIALNLIFIPIYGIVGAAIATASSLFVYNFSKFVFVLKKLSIQPFSWKIVGVLTNGLLVLFISFQLPVFDNIYIDIIFRSVFITFLYSSIILIFNLSDEFKSTVNGIIKKLLSKIKPKSH